MCGVLLREPSRAEPVSSLICERVAEAKNQTKKPASESLSAMLRS